MLKNAEKLSSDSVRAKSLTDAILLMLCVDLQPLSYTEDFGFSTLIKQA